MSEDDLMAANQQNDSSQVSSGNQARVSSNLPTQEDKSPDPSEAILQHPHLLIRLRNSYPNTAPQHSTQPQESS